MSEEGKLVSRTRRISKQSIAVIATPIKGSDEFWYSVFSSGDILEAGAARMKYQEISKSELELIISEYLGGNKRSGYEFRS